MAGSRGRAGARGWPARAAPRRDERRGSGGFACRAPDLGAGPRGGFGRRRAGPVFRATLHLLRGQWWRGLNGRADEADRSWLWYENTDAVGWPSAEAQPADVDWALGSYARLLRAELDRRENRREAACDHATRLRRSWSHAEPGFFPATARLHAVADWCRR